MWLLFGEDLLLYVLMVCVNTMVEDNQNFFKHLKICGLGSKAVVYHQVVSYAFCFFYCNQ